MTRLALLLSALWLGCGTAPMEANDGALQLVTCEPPAFAPADCNDVPERGYRICWPGDGTYWLWQSACYWGRDAVIHQELGKTAEDVALCRSGGDR